MRTTTAMPSIGFAAALGLGGGGRVRGLDLARSRQREDWERYSQLANRLRAGLEARRAVALVGAPGASSIGLAGASPSRPVGVVGARPASCYNARVLMNCCDPESQERTADPDDRAHQVRDSGGLVPARLALGAKPRRYHPSQMVGPAGGRVGLDSAAERLDDAMRRLGLGRAPSMASAVREGLAAAAARVDRGGAASGGRSGAGSLRDLVEPRTRVRLTPGELELERRASELLVRSRTVVDVVGVGAVVGVVGVGGVGGGHG